MTRKVYVYPFFRGPDKGDGGMRRVYDAMVQHLPAHGWEVVREAAGAEVANLHATGLARDVLKADMPIVASCHGLYWTPLYDWPRALINANAAVVEVCRIADEITAPTEWVANTLRRNLWRPVHVIPHGVDLDEWPIGDPTGGVIMKQKRLEIPGGFVLWNKARTDGVSDPRPVSELAHRLPDVPIVSTFGPENAPNVTILGKVTYPAMREVVLAAGVYLATARETFGIGTIEAMAAGVPVVGFRWGGQREIITHKVDGYLAKPHDYDDLAVGIKWALENRESAGRAARRTIMRDYRWDQVIAGYADAFVAAADRDWRRPDAPKISVLMPVKDLEGYAEAAIKSVVDQDLQEWELLIGDNASDDDTWPRVSRMAETDPRIQAFRWPQDLGLSGNRDALLERATGRYVISLDGDDRFAPGALRRFVNALDHDRTADIAYGDITFIDVAKDGKPFQSSWPVPRFNFRDQLSGRNQIPQCSAIRRDLLEHVGGWRRRAGVAEDADLWCRATSFGARVIRVDGKTTGRPPVVELHTHNRSGQKGSTEKQRAWQDWYPWSIRRKLTPYGALANLRDAEDGGIDACEIWPLEEPQVTVIVPIGPGHAEHAITALDSIMAQSMRGWEAIAVIDHDGDGTGLPPWTRVMVSCRQKSGLCSLSGDPVEACHRGHGVARARNVGIAAARATATVFLDADDYLTPTALQELLQARERIPSESPGFIYPDYIAQGPDGEMEARQLDDWSPKRFMAQAVHGITALYPTRRLREVGGFDEELPCWEDWDLAWALADLGLCAYHLERPLYVYRMTLGRRRDDNAARRDEGLAAIREKWNRYIDGGAQMPCSGCSGKLSQPKVAGGTKAAGVLAARAGDEMVWVEYTGDSQSVATYGPQTMPTRTRYRFGGDGAHRGRYVHAADAAFFESHLDFRVSNTREEETAPEVRGHEIVAQADAPDGPPPQAVAPVQMLVAEPEQESTEEPDYTGPPTRDELELLRRDELRAMASEVGITSRRLNKTQLVDAILEQQSVPA